MNIFNNFRYVTGEKSLYSSPEEVVHIARIIRWIAVELKFTCDRVNEIELALVEAINNSIQHANDLDTSKQVTVNWFVDDVSLKIEVIDSGKKMQNQPVGLLPPTNIHNGRGWHLITACMNEARWYPENPGNRVVLIKYFSKNQKTMIHSTHSTF